MGRGEFDHTDGSFGTILCLKFNPNPIQLPVHYLTRGLALIYHIKSIKIVGWVVIVTTKSLKSDSPIDRQLEGQRW